MTRYTAYAYKDLNDPSAIMIIEAETLSVAVSKILELMIRKANVFKVFTLEDQNHRTLVTAQFSLTDHNVIVIKYYTA